MQKVKTAEPRPCVIGYDDQAPDLAFRDVVSIVTLGRLGHLSRCFSGPDNDEPAVVRRHWQEFGEYPVRLATRDGLVKRLRKYLTLIHMLRLRTQVGIVCDFPMTLKETILAAPCTHRSALSCCRRTVRTNKIARIDVPQSEIR